MTVGGEGATTGAIFAGIHPKYGEMKETAATATINRGRQV